MASRRVPPCLTLLAGCGLTCWEPAAGAAALVFAAGFPSSPELHPAITSTAETATASAVADLPKALGMGQLLRSSSALHVTHPPLQAHGPGLTVDGAGAGGKQLRAIDMRPSHCGNLGNRRSGEPGGTGESRGARGRGADVLGYLA